MKIASWNINSIKARLEHVKRWLETNQPDVLMLQELKGLDFPDQEFESLGYRSAHAAQKTYNGVATLSKTPVTVILDKLPGDPSDEHARYLETDIDGYRLINIYLPNGNPAPGDKFDYKLRWMDRLYTRLHDLREQEVPFVIGGDFNVIPDDKDCYDPKAWKDDALFRPESRQAFRKFLNLGLTDAFRVYNHAAGQYTFWDYQGGAWPADKGIRIDHFLLCPAATDQLSECSIDKSPRGEEKASDHTPVIVNLAA